MFSFRVAQESGRRGEYLKDLRGSAFAFVPVLCSGGGGESLFVACLSRSVTRKSVWCLAHGFGD